MRLYPKKKSHTNKSFPKPLQEIFSRFQLEIPLEKHGDYLKVFDLENQKKLDLDYKYLIHLGHVTIQTICTEWLYEEFRNLDEGELSQLKNHLCSNELIDFFGKKLNLLKLARTIKWGKVQKKQINRVLLEGLLGRLLLDFGYNAVQTFSIQYILNPMVEKHKLLAYIKDSVSAE